jgi:pimeloyl-ACP methyl ester carboxylesterase
MIDAEGMTRREVFAAAAVVGAAASGLFPTGSAQAHQAGFTMESAQYSWTPEPPQVPVTERMIDVGGARLWTWDTGGSGPAVVLLHAFTGSGATWGYQQPVLAAAGYRVIGYSRRGHFRSESGPLDATGTLIGDLISIVDQLGIDRFHLVGTAAGGFSVFDCALSHPDRLYSLTLASSLGGIDEAEYTAVSSQLLPPGWRELPSEFREIGPSYRAANPAGTQRWIELEHAALVGQRINQARSNPITWANLQTITTPALLMTGGADLYMPPARLPQIAAHLPNSRWVAIPEAGHAAFWEQPDAFNRQLLAHFAATSPANDGPRS